MSHLRLRLVLYLVLVLAVILFPIFPQTRLGETNKRVEWTPISLPKLPQPHEWHDPLYYILHILAWIAHSGSHEMQKYPLEVVYATPATVGTTASQY